MSGGNRKQKQLHYILIQAAWSASRYDPGLMSLFGRLHKRRLSSQRTICVIAKKLLFIIRAVLLENREYQRVFPEKTTTAGQGESNLEPTTA